MRVLLILVLLVAAGAAWLAWRSAGSSVTPRPLESMPQAGLPDAQAGARPGPTAPLERATADLSNVATVDAPAPVVPIEDRVPESFDDAEWSRTYAGWTLARLDARLLELEAKFQAEVERCCDQRFETGLYRTVSGEEMEGEDNGYDVLSNLDAQGMIMRTRAVPTTALDPSQPIDEDDAGRVEYQIVSLPQDMYAPLYRQKSEVDWLRASLAARVAAGEDPP